MKTIKDINLTNKTVLLRTGFDVPIEKGKVVDHYRIAAGLPTIRYLVQRNCKIIIIFHIGRPEGKVAPKLEVEPVRAKLSSLLGCQIPRAVSYQKEQVAQEVAGLQGGRILLLENLRFLPEEIENDQGFARDLASLAQIYVQDAFSVLHRDHASVTGIPKYLPTVAGLLLEKEIKKLQQAKEEPLKPAIVIIGGAKTETKIPVLDNLLAGNFDQALIGGVVANNFLISQGVDLKKSRIDADFIEDSQKLLKKYNFILGTGFRVDDEIILPSDFVWNDQDQIFDIGPQTIKQYQGIISSAQTIIWNGPMGVFEEEKFAGGTREIAKAILGSRAKKIVGGGDTVAALIKFKLLDKFDFVSTGGGVMLKFLAGEKLPGLEVL